MSLLQRNATQYCESCKVQLTRQYQNRIHQHVYKSSGESNWSKLMAEAISSRNYSFLLEICCHGRGHNDKSKEALCDIANTKRTLTANGIKKVIAELCGVRLIIIELHQAYIHKTRQFECKSQTLVNEFLNGSDVQSQLEDAWASGFNQITRVGRSLFLSNDENSGIRLKGKAMREFGIALVEFKEIECRYLEAIS
ncbi:hypothetical protein [Vibrio nigripulchritudo]|uniref:hypothetical protein n=1 Tax=Vibrio nigripulchritudo TaxID=28173 RepID=UPI00190B0435|nr:hypothetical protein [Vibrio nigripulchritudo]